ncbi:ATP-binding cassette, subfamily F, uup [Tistlia consotensis]|uniref:ATP-binding protein Uup n=1 Tax=Tistlia consotensis USBA 355 TaxID=560819 RepID=A0A1Y6CK55_9PROT|nr:ATP-binding cassette domain-containing protein [Tistlia consotensis]SMF70987.1 ATP-binding cassette, subfamily F, uup [Tistlia consotensis USBA 355]SNS07182.1 ATP-binding cassette, subfamily F, uup [Tistlia consotensis]
MAVAPKSPAKAAAKSPPLIALQSAGVDLGNRKLFVGLDLALARGERACLVGRNGSGKSTILRLLCGLQEPDSGQRFLQPGTRVGYLPQDPALPSGTTVRDYVAAELEPEALHVAEAAIERLSLDLEARLGTLSGGAGRRAALARVLAGTPDVLLLDEPTNHLDLPTILWLEEQLNRWRGAMLTISHDRRFLEDVSSVVLWLDRGELRRMERSFAHFDAWADEVAASEAKELDRLGNVLRQEEHWLQRGVTARRRRNEGRLARLKELRATRAKLLARRQGEATIEIAEAERGGTVALEAENLTKRFDGRPVIEGFSTRIRQGDRVGLVGRNGAGKTTLINLLLGRLAPDAGKVKLGANVQAEVFDQRRQALDPEASLWQTLCPTGGDMVQVGGRQRHVVAYLRDFLFEEAQARQPVKALSGGEKNRLLLARLFARPSNLLVLDEPTNDLDMDTLDLLEEVLADYAGTLLLVSHDRDFLDRLCNSVILLDGRGGAVEYPGGFSDAIRQAGGLPDAVAPVERPAAAAAPGAEAPRPARTAKLSYKEQRELDQLPGRIAALEGEIAAIEAQLADPGLYSREPARFAERSARLEAAQGELEAAEMRWLELEEKRESLAREATG